VDPMELRLQQTGRYQKPVCISSSLPRSEAEAARLARLVVTVDKADKCRLAQRARGVRCNDTT
jgi:hypothetical protein